MSDSMCGPSTAFKGLIDHQSHDRSLQQEIRGVQHTQQPSTFRSNVADAPQHNHSFTSFIGQGSSLQQITSGLNLNAGLPITNTLSNAAVVQPASQLSHPNDTALHQTYVHPGKLAVSALPNGASIESRPQAFASPTMAAQMYSQSMAHMQRMAATVSAPAPMDNFQFEMDRWVAANLGVASNNAPATTAHDPQQDFSEVNDIMDQLAEDLARDIAINTPSPPLPENSLRADTDTTLPMMESAQREDKGQTTENTSEISQVARQILTSVEHEDDEKWKNSAFLALMRDFRDGNKEILNDEIQETRQ